MVLSFLREEEISPLGESFDTRVSLHNDEFSETYTANFALIRFHTERLVRQCPRSRVLKVKRFVCIFVSRL